MHETSRAAIDDRAWTIRPIREGEGPAVCDLILRCFWRFNAGEYGTHSKRFTDRITAAEMERLGAQQLLLVALASPSDIVGTIAVVERAHLELMFVREDMQRLGLGGMLWMAALEHLARHGEPVTQITVNASQFAQSFYRRLGFVPQPSDRPELRPMVWQG